MAFKFCMPDTDEYSTYYNKEGCSQVHQVGTGGINADRVVFGPTGDHEANAIDVVDAIQRNPWTSSKDKL